MKKKWIGFCVIAACLSVPLLQWFSAETALDKQHLTSSDSIQNESIVAPAMIDSLNDITRIPALQPGVINQIQVTVGQEVKKGQLLFSLDSRLIENTVAIQRIRLEEAKNEVLSQEKQLKHIKQQLTRLRSVDSRAISRADLQEKIYEANMGKVHLTQAKQNLALAKANLKQTKLTLNQFNTVAPEDGIVLQVNAHPNEFVAGGQPIVFLGNAKKIIVRVSLDERDIERFDPSASAYITNTENPTLNIPLTFMQLDRYIVTQERLNSRVQEALYYFARKDYPAIVAGQQFDANISVRSKA